MLRVGEEVHSLTNRLRCPRYRAGFAVELKRMRKNVPNSCPSCGFPCEISEDQAIRAQRLLDRLEYYKRIVTPIPSSGTMST
jgi:hypothetical protein